MTITMTPTEFARSHNRPVPEWFNLDALVDADELVEVEAIRAEMRTFVREAIVLGERVRWALALANRFACSIDDSVQLFNDAAGMDEIIDLVQALDDLFGENSTPPDEATVDSYQERFPELAAALRQVRSEDVRGVPARGSFEVPRKATTTKSEAAR